MNAPTTDKRQDRPLFAKLNVEGNVSSCSEFLMNAPLKKRNELTGMGSTGGAAAITPRPFISPSAEHKKASREIDTVTSGGGHGWGT